MNSTSNGFWQWMGSQKTDDVVALLIFGGVAIVGVILILALTALYMHKNKLNYSLKRELLDQGMSADEIVAIISAGPPTCRSRKLGV